MQAQFVSRELGAKFDRIVRDGQEQYGYAGSAPTTALRLEHALNAEVYFAHAWAVADSAALIAPSRDYQRWVDRRSKMAKYGEATRARILELARIQAVVA